MVRPEQWYRRLLTFSSSEGRRCGSFLRWRVFTCHRSTGGRSALRVELANGVAFHSPIVNATSPKALILGDNRPSNKITGSPSAHTAFRHHRFRTPPRATRGFLRRRQARSECQSAPSADRLSGTAGDMGSSDDYMFPITRFYAIGPVGDSCLLAAPAYKFS